MQSAQRAAMVAAVSSLAQSLASRDGENPEYDRALVDLTSAVLGLAKDDVAQRILAPGSPLR